MRLGLFLPFCLSGSAIVLGGAGLLFAFLAYQESRLPFDAQGRYFDSAEAVVHLEQDVLGYALIAGGLFVAAIVLLVIRSCVKRALCSAPE